MEQQMISDVHHIWISEEERIASFHEIEGYQMRIVRGREEYVAFLQTLQERGFRFQ